MDTIASMAAWVANQIDERDCMPQTRDNLIRQHMANTKKVRKDHFCLANTSGSSKPGGGGVPADPASLTLVLLSALALGTVHRGRVLRGTLIVEPYRMVSFLSLLEDEKGDVVVLGVYGLQHSGPLQKGATIAIVEPYFKAASSGGTMVRVDEPSEVLTLTQLAPLDAAGWLKEDGAHVARKEFQDARAAYGRALGQPSLAAQLLSNISATLLKKGAFSCALTYAAGAYAAAASPEEAAAKKGRARAATALRELGAAGAEVAWWAGDDGLAERGVGAAVARGGAPLPMPDGGGEETPDALKAAGNALFSCADWDGALRQYLLALAALPLTAALLRNRSLCSLELGMPTQACLEAMAASAADPTNAKAWFRRAKAALELGWAEEAAAACEAGLALMPGETGLSELSRRADALRISPGGPRRVEEPPLRVGSVPGAKTIEEREMAAHRYEDAATVSKLAMVSDMFDQLDPAQRAKAGLPPKVTVAPFHDEMAREGSWPVGCDVAACMVRLRSYFEHTRGLDTLHLGFIELGQEAPMRELDLVKRCHGVKPEMLRQLADPAVSMGAVMQHATEAPTTSYHGRMVHSFANAPGEQMACVAGSTHVALGFNDLTSLYDCKVRENKLLFRVIYIYIYIYM